MCSVFQFRRCKKYTQTESVGAVTIIIMYRFQVFAVEMILNIIILYTNNIQYTIRFNETNIVKY